MKTNSATIITWFSRLLRWLLGAAFITVGILHAKAGGWPAILFGALIFITGFFRPRRCIGGECSLPPHRFTRNTN
ncbi:MAG: hypothetical protein J7621_02290 [Niastella sp.]|nr:hypothetical protein [Niastella sp.]